ncbi:NAD(+) kinase [Inmirania thermothiophila]|uniref:NAD kinase n=1 Tax=Inmirania thermothiophila TaxID=1750597 RepID=A0A3N1XZQ8_9GAMM|nr:NAD(+) kinase [Inmirania thermothiophila]ROR32076.1 NAD+ kinase [Inmirania thermothiophila]
MSFATIGIIGKHGDPAVGETIARLAALLAGRDLRLLLDEATAETCPGLELETADREALGRACDLVLIVGGDGTLLHAARSLVEHEVPLLGINLGRRGFLVDVSPAEMEATLDRILDGAYEEERRFLLAAEVVRDGERVGAARALNDVVVHKLDVARMIETEAHVDGRHLYTLRSDGLIVATPTGSTAYALSGGGPILEPSLDALVLVPICPHSLSNRPFVTGADAVVEIRVHAHAAQLTCDGQINLQLEAGDRVRVRRMAPPIRLIHPPGHDYYEILRTKLHWNR